MRKKVLLMYVLAFSFIHARSQEIPTDSSDRAVQLEEVVISANKFAERKKNIAQRIDIVSAKQIAAINVQNTGDLLLNTGNVFVQKSQQGGSSPVIRGFEASRVLLVIDGVRMNNAIYRSGHLQNVITVDQNMLERVEILYGPASTIYGSDALGGVVNLRTRMPVLSDEKPVYGANAFTRFSSANNERTIHADGNIGFKKIGLLTSFTASEFGDMRMGDRYTSKYPDFGRRSYYIQRINGTDSILRNSDDRYQRFSGYRQWDLLQKILYRPSDRISHSLNFQYSNSSNVPRYDRLQDVRNGNLRFAEWYYGPQQRTLLAYELLATDLAMFFTDIKANVNYQDISESRHQREYRNDLLDNRFENIKVIGYSIDGRRRWNKHELNIGIDGQFNDVSSSAYRKNIVTSERLKLDSRYPDGENFMNNVAIYFQHLYKIIPEKLILNDGIRFQNVSLRSSLVDTATQLHLPYTQISQNSNAVTGNLGLVYLPARNTKISLLLASGFRSPNIDDLSRIFESSTILRQVVVPNPNIRPEYTYNIDLSVNHTFANKLSIGITGFYTWFRNAIVVAPFQLNGQDSIVYNGVLSAVLASQNRARAFIYGGNLNINADITDHLSVISTLNYTYGRYRTDPGVPTSVFQRQPDGSHHRVVRPVSEKPLDHIPPVFGKIAVNYHRHKWNIEAFSLFNGRKHIIDFNADGEDNAQYATPEGMPGWITLNLRSRFEVNRHLTIQAGLENILDKNYRNFASGFSAPGRNFVLTLRAKI